MNFDSLPNEKPAGFVVPEGTYRAKISNAGMKQPKDSSKKPYLNFKLDLFDIKTKEKVGSIFDSLFDSEASLVLYKLKRFITALNIKLTTFELSDLAKLINGKELLVDVKTESKEGQQDRSIVDATKDEIYYPLSEAETVTGGTTEKAPINAIDGSVTMANVDEVF